MKRKKIILIVLAVIMLLALLLSFDFTSEKVGAVIGVAGQKVKDVARTVLGIAIGAFLIYSGVLAISVPVVGIALVVVGVALLAYSVWPFFKKPDLTE